MCPSAAGRISTTRMLETADGPREEASKVRKSTKRRIILLVPTCLLPKGQLAGTASLAMWRVVADMTSEQRSWPALVIWYKQSRDPTKIWRSDTGTNEHGCVTVECWMRDTYNTHLLLRQLQSPEQKILLLQRNKETLLSPSNIMLLPTNCNVHTKAIQ